jgi:hypothetical protein
VAEAGVTARTPLDVEIDRVTAAVRRAAEALDALRSEAAGGCCPDCVLGGRYTVPAEAQTRRRAWLVVLLGKRGAAGDADLARSVEWGTWP